MCELVLQVNTEVHILHRVDHNVYELHAGHLETESNVSSLHNIKNPFICEQTVGHFVPIEHLWTHHEVDVAVVIDEVLHQLLKAVPFSAHLRKNRKECFFFL